MSGKGRGKAGGHILHAHEGYRWMYFPDIHGRNVDKEAFSTAVALSSWYKPDRVIIGGDLADFEAISRFESQSEAALYMGDDIGQAMWAMGEIAKYNPKAEKFALEGNHDRRWRRYLWKHPAIESVLKKRGMDLPSILGVGDYGFKWVESGLMVANEKFVWKHGHAVRARSSFSAMAEMDRLGVSGASGHTHRLGMFYKTTLNGMLVWAESGCLCRLDPPYAEGQIMDWQHGVSLGSVDYEGNGFTVHTVPIVNGRARVLGFDVSA